MLTLGAGKSSTAHIIEVASVSYKDKGFKYVKTIPSRTRDIF